MYSCDNGAATTAQECLFETVKPEDWLISENSGHSSKHVGNANAMQALSNHAFGPQDASATVLAVHYLGKASLNAWQSNTKVPRESLIPSHRFSSCHQTKCTHQYCLPGFDAANVYANIGPA